MDDVKQCKHGRNFCVDCHMSSDQMYTAAEALKPENQRVYPIGTERDWQAELDTQRLRADTAEAENRILRHSNSSFLETVAKVCDLLGIDLDDAKHADGQPSDVLFSHAKDQAEKLAAAEQRISGLKARYNFLSKVTPYKFRKMQEAASTDGGDVIYFHADRFDAQIDAALNPNPEAESHE
ncbi:hypothetical protein [Pseudomonas sp. SDO52101_S400]